MNRLLAAVTVAAGGAAVVLAGAPASVRTVAVLVALAAAPGLAMLPRGGVALTLASGCAASALATTALLGLDAYTPARAVVVIAALSTGAALARTVRRLRATPALELRP